MSLSGGLQSKGCSFGSQKGSHLKVYLDGKQSVLPMHGKKELGTGLVKAIKKQLGIEE
jgi:mRNA interferase HicA